MKVVFRLICLLTLIITITAAYGGEVIVPFQSGTSEISTSGGETVLSIPNFSEYVSPGDPALPYTESYVLLPPGADMGTLKVRIKNAVEKRITATHPVSPTPPMLASVDGKKLVDWGRGKKIKNGRNTLVYEKNAFYPANYATLDSDSRLGPYKLVPVRFWPYRYNPVTGEIRHLVKGEVVISFDSTNVPATSDPFAAAQLERLAINSDQADSWYGTATASEALPAVTTPLAIITTQTIANSSSKLSAFISHKSAMGYSVTLAAQNWGTGNTAAENIRNWLKANYTDKARYAILIGNPNPSTGDVPMKMLWPRHGAGDGYEDGPSDYYFADMTGNWDKDGDGYYGESEDFGPGGVDRVPEVIVGRIPYYGSITDLDKILQKIINYENASIAGEWAYRMLLPMEPLDDTTPGWQLGEQIKTNVAIPSSLGYYRIYEDNYGINPPPEKIPCNTSNVQNAWVNGYGFVFWSTHGNTNIAADVFGSWMCSALNDNTPAFVFQGSCLNGHPESTDNLGYSLLKNGAVSTVSATRVSWYYPSQSDFRSTDSVGGMTYRYALELAKNHLACGNAIFTMKTGVPFSIWANHAVFNLYGDPTVLPWASMVIKTTSFPTGTVGESYSTLLEASGGTSPYTWSIISGSLPTGLTLSADGAISGTPTIPGTSNFTVQVVDSAGKGTVKSLSMTIVLPELKYNLDSDPGWTCQGGWAYGVPTGGGSNNKDPKAGHTGSQVYGYNLSGDYANGMTTAEYLTTKAIDCSSLQDTKLSFWRWLGVESTNDQATVQVSNDGTNWITLWSNGSLNIQDSEWVQQEINISSIADGSPTVYIRWGMGPTNPTVTAPGWNIDDIQITGSLTKPFIRHTPLETTDTTTSPYEITVEVITANSLMNNNPKIMWSTGGNYAGINMTQTSGNFYTGYIPAQPAGTTVHYYIAATDRIGTAYLPSVAPVEAFSFDVISDTEPPVITHTPLGNTSNTTGPYHVTATVTDNLGVASVNLTYARNGGTPATVEMIKSTNPDTPNDYSADIPSPASGLDWFTYNITATDVSQSHLQSSAPASGSYMFSILSDLQLVYSFPMDSSPGWTTEGNWAFGTPTGGGSTSHDPTSGHTGSFVYGYNLDGEYTNNMSQRLYLTSSPIDCTLAANTTLKFWRWLGVEGWSRDGATIDVSKDGVNWTTVWHNSTAIINDNDWVQVSYDIHAVADGQPTVYVRWGMGTTDSSIVYCGWNIDDVEIWAEWRQVVDQVSAVRLIPDGTVVELQGGVVSAAMDGYFYVQDPGSYQGIRVAWSGAVTEGAPVVIRGGLRTREGEREIVASNVIQSAYIGDIKPIGMAGISVGGTDLGNPVIQSGVAGGIGPNNIGTLVKVWGKVTQTGSSYFYIDDGSGLSDSTGSNGLRILWPGNSVSEGQYVTVVGVSTGFKDGTNFTRAVQPRRSEDIVPN